MHILPFLLLPLLPLAISQAASKVQVFPVCPPDLSQRALEAYEKCASCVNSVSTEDAIGPSSFISPCNGTCCARIDYAVGTGHFLTCSKGCCQRLVSLQLSPGLSEEQAAFVMSTQTIVNNDETFVESTGIGRCQTTIGPKPDCGPPCASMFRDRKRCEGRRTAHVPKVGEDMELPPCSTAFDDEAPFDVQNSSFDEQNSEDGGEDGGREEQSDGKAACFPADALVKKRGGWVKMQELGVGDEVLSEVGWSKVFAFSHQDKVVVAQFVQISTRGGFRIGLSEGHYVFVEGGLKTAGEVEAGDVVYTVTGEDVVVKVSRVWKRGLYNPHTRNGELIVDGVRVSAYTNAMKVNTAHALLAVFRLRFGKAVLGIADGLRWVVSS